MSASSTTSFGNSSASPDSALPNASRRESPLVPMSAGASADRLIQILLDLPARHFERQQSLFGLFAGKFHAAVPGGDVLHVGNALALDSVGDDHAGPVACRTGAAQGREQCADVMAVDLRHGPVERAPFDNQQHEPQEHNKTGIAL